MKLFSPSSRSGFSLLELLIVLVIIGIVLAIGVPGVNKARADAELETMRTRALALQSAKLNFIDSVGTQNASGSWNSRNDAARYQDLLRQYLPTTYPNNLTGTGGLIPSPYGITLNNLSTNINFIAPDSTGSRVSTPLQKY